MWTNSWKLQNTSTHNMLAGNALAFAKILYMRICSMQCRLVRKLLFNQKHLSCIFPRGYTTMFRAYQAFTTCPIWSVLPGNKSGFTSPRHCKGKDSKHYMRYGSFCPINMKWETSLLFKTAVVWFYSIKKGTYFLWNKRMVCKACNKMQVSEY